LTNSTLDRILYITIRKEGKNMRTKNDSRDRALELVEEGFTTAEDMLTMCLKWMSTDDVEEMLDANELSDRFLNEEEDTYA